MKHLALATSLICALAVLGACSDEVQHSAVPPPTAMTEESVGHYCNMAILEHEGPKAQVHLKGRNHPLWFSQVRDAVVFLRSPEELEETVIIYVHDMSKAESWAHPGDGAWIDAAKAIFVIGSRKTGSMSAPEAIPFETAEAADAFIASHGGRAVTLEQIPDDYVRGTANLSVTAGETKDSLQ